MCVALSVQCPRVRFRIASLCSSCQITFNVSARSLEEERRRREKAEAENRVLLEQHEEVLLAACAGQHCTQSAGAGPARDHRAAR